MSTNKPSNAALDERLEKLYRENVRLCEEVQHMLQEDSDEMNLLTSLKILAALKHSSEDQMAQATVKELSSAQVEGKRTASGKLSRVKKGGKGGAIVDDAEAEAAPSPRIHLSARTAKDKTSRQNSIPTTREASVKLEADGAESVASSTDMPASASTTATAAAKGSSTRTSNRLVLTKGEIVFCRHDSKTFTSKAEPPDGEGILCRVTNVIGEGKQRRYEVQDADTSSDPPPPQRASVSQLIQIPELNRGLSDLTKGRQVLAEYPDTTTFYKADVQEAWKGDGKTEWVKLRFEDDEVPREVERRFVLTEK
jgi:SAGA-associated factor 29